MLNSPLREIPRNQRATVIPSRQETSLLDWLQSSGRLIARDVQDPDFRETEEEIESLMGVEDGIGDFDFDDDDEIVPDEE